MDLSHVAGGKLLIGLAGELPPVKHASILVEGGTLEQIFAYSVGLFRRVKQFLELFSITAEQLSAGERHGMDDPARELAHLLLSEDRVRSYGE